MSNTRETKDENREPNTELKREPNTKGRVGRSKSIPTAAIASKSKKTTKREPNTK